MRLVYGVDEEPDGFRVHHVDVFLRHCPAPGLVEKIDPVTAVRNVEAQVPALYVRGQIDRLRRDLLRVSGARIGVDADEAVLLVRDPTQKDCRGGKRPHHVEMFLADLPWTQFRMGFHRAVRVPGREVVVVEDPHAHIALFRLSQDDVHIAPPTVSGEIAVRPGFHAERPTAAAIDALDLRRDRGGMIAVLPVEGEHVVALFAV